VPRGHPVTIRRARDRALIAQQGITGGTGDNDEVLTDEQVAAMSPQERAELISRLAHHPAVSPPSPRVLRLIREARLTLTLGAVVVLVPWIVYLALTLPRLYVAHNWDITWVGFDTMLLALLLATGVLAALRRQLVSLTAFAAGILLACDAWFDVMTSHGSDKAVSEVTALVIELPLAALLLFGSLQVLRLCAGPPSGAGAGVRAWQVPIALPNPAEAPREPRAGRARRSSDGA
jgi:hypothetical protein